MPEQLTWDREKGYARLGHKPYIYNPESGWLIDPATNVYHDAYYGWAYDPTTNGLIDEETGKRYTMSYEAIEE